VVGKVIGEAGQQEPDTQPVGGRERVAHIEQIINYNKYCKVR